MRFDDAAAGFPPRYDAGWSNFYSRFPRQPQLSSMLPDYVARNYKQVPGVGQVGWGGELQPPWTFAPEAIVARERELRGICPPCAKPST